MKRKILQIITRSDWAGGQKVLYGCDIMCADLNEVLLGRGREPVSRGRTELNVLKNCIVLYRKMASNALETKDLIGG